MHALVVFFDADADARVRALWRRIGASFEHPPHLTYAVAGAIGPKVRAELREDLSRLWLPDLWLHTLGVFSTTENVLQLGAVVDGELLAVHSAIHDVLAGRVKNPSAYYLPGNWVPHCTLLHGVDDAEVVRAFAALHPVEPIRAKVREVSVVDTQTGGIDPLRKASTAPR
ncbi:2'-5' RNA ligase family protein [Saccharothrix algeriensis]|uniref:2'-5' RNA ligase n=1 Tax=Saccharothrix algeriensis TaxID=173560 RepID=A0A8T8I475_9PSEU|nr:2'-5' RNA ligase family protein [Saccharothrix algeriensis]MBM7811819.1 2'-5' RNA ligase [Saccharothrix algeriensis]QTR05556.1 2'-5' RNA ligase family protein [Saccharothrix algeriensis]